VGGVVPRRPPPFETEVDANGVRVAGLGGAWGPSFGADATPVITSAKPSLR